MATTTNTQVRSLSTKRKKVPSSMSGLIWYRFTRHKVAVAALIFIILLILASALVPLLRSHDPYHSSFRTRWIAPFVIRGVSVNYRIWLSDTAMMFHVTRKRNG